MLHRDIHVVFNGSYYSAPHRLIGKELWVAGTESLVKIYDDYELVAQHVAAHIPGTRRTDPAHIPAEQRAYAEQSPEWCCKAAAEIGPFIFALVEKLLAERPSDRPPTARGIIKLRRKYSNRLLDLACRRALFFGELKYRTVRSILEKGLDSVALPGFEATAPIENSPRPRFAREGRELFPGPGEGEGKCRQPLN